MSYPALEACSNNEYNEKGESSPWLIRYIRVGILTIRDNYVVIHRGASEYAPGTHIYSGALDPWGLCLPAKEGRQRIQGRLGMFVTPGRRCLHS